MAKVIKSSHPTKKYADGGVISGSRAFDDQSATTVAADRQRLDKEAAQLRAANKELNPKVRPGKDSLEYEIAYRKKLGADRRTR